MIFIPYKEQNFYRLYYQPSHRVPYLTQPNIEQSKLRFSFRNNSDDIESSKDGAKAFRGNFSV